MNKQDYRDWYVIIHISAFASAVMTYAFKYPSPAVFATACGTLTTVIGMYHWFVIKDDKEKDCA